MFAHVALQVAETVTTLGLFHLITAGRRAETPDGAPDLFNYDPRGPFRKPTGWLTWAALGIVLSPVLVGTVASLVEATGYETQVSGRWRIEGRWWLGWGAAGVAVGCCGLRRGCRRVGNQAGWGC